MTEILLFCQFTVIEFNMIYLIADFFQYGNAGRLKQRKTWTHSKDKQLQAICIMSYHSRNEMFITPQQVTSFIDTLKGGIGNRSLLT